MLNFLLFLFVISYTALAYLTIFIFCVSAEVQHTLIILGILILQLLHRRAAHELDFMASWSCIMSKFVVAFIIALLTVQYSAENPIIIGEGVYDFYYVFDIIVFMKSTLQMGVMYIMLGLCTFDALLGLILYGSKKKREVRTVSLIMQTIILIVFLILMRVEIYTELL